MQGVKPPPYRPWSTNSTTPNPPTSGAAKFTWSAGGPGDPDLLTFRALRLMQQATSYCTTGWLPPAIVELVRKEAKRIYVGKRSDSHTVPQSELNEHCWSNWPNRANAYCA